MAAASIQVVQRFYQSLAKGEMDFGLLDEGIEWVTPASLPWTVAGARECGGTVAYRGLEEFGRYLQSLTAAVRDMRAEADEFFEMGEGRIAVTGREVGEAVESGRSFAAPFVHILSVADGKITRLHGSVDTAVIQEACRRRD